MFVGFFYILCVSKCISSSYSIFFQLKVFTSEIKEGTMYQSGVDLSNDDITSFEEIPDHDSIPNSTSLVTVDPTPNCSFLYFDLETTGFGKLLACILYDKDKSTCDFL